jgi:hypothetical protein
MEVWRKIKSYPNYEISSYGKVKNLTTSENMKLRKRDDKYIDVGLTKNGEQKNELLHRLVAKAFCKKQPGEIEVDHKDKNRSNNKSDNLRWVSGSDNQRNKGIAKNNSSGVPGVFFDKEKQCWIGNYYSIDQKQKSKSFSVSKYGNLEAKQKAILYRKEKELKNNYH